MKSVKHFGIYEYFDKVISGDNLKCAKPSSCPLEDAINNFNLEKKSAIMVGNST